MGLTVAERLAICEAVDHAAKDADASLPVSAECHIYVWEVVGRIVTARASRLADEIYSRKHADLDSVYFALRSAAAGELPDAEQA